MKNDSKRCPDCNKLMHHDGYDFYHADTGNYLCDSGKDSRRK